MRISPITAVAVSRSRSTNTSGWMFSSEGHSSDLSAPTRASNARVVSLSLGAQVTDIVLCASSLTGRRRSNAATTSASDTSSRALHPVAVKNVAGCRALHGILVHHGSEELIELGRHLPLRANEPVQSIDGLLIRREGRESLAAAAKRVGDVVLDLAHATDAGEQ